MIKKLLFSLYILYSSFFNVFPQDVDKAWVFFDAGQYEKAAIEFENALPAIEKKYGSTDTTYYSIYLIYTALSYDRIQQSTKAINYYLKAKEVYELKKTIECKMYASVLNNLASLYTNIGVFEKAETLLLQTLIIRKKTIGENSPEYATDLNNLAVLYYSMGNYEKAEPIFLQALQIKKKVLGEDNTDYALSLSNLASIYKSMGNYEKAEPLYQQAMQIRKKVLGEESADYASSLNSLAGLYQAMGFFDKAQTFYLQALQIRKKVLGEEHADYAISLNNLANLYREMGDYEKAKLLFIQALQIEKKILGEESPDYAFFLNNLANLFKDMGDYEKAESMYLQSLQIRKNVMGKEHPDYATNLNNLAELYREMGQYKKAEPLYLQAIEIRKRVLGEKHPLYAAVLNNLGILYEDLSNYEKAEELLIKSSQIRKDALGEKHPDYLASLNNLATLYTMIANYEKAESLYVESLKITKNLYGEENRAYAITLNNLADLYSILGNYEKALDMHLQALKIRKKILGIEHPDYGSSLNNLSIIYEKIGDLQMAELFCLQSILILKNTFGEEHPDYIMGLNNLASIYEDMGKFDKADSIFLKVLTIRKKILSENHPDYVLSLNNLAFLYLLMGEYKKAETLYLESIEINKKTNQEEQPLNINCLMGLADIYKCTGNYDKVAPLIIKAYYLIESQIYRQSEFLSENEMSMYLNSIIYKFDIFKGYFLQLKKVNPELIGESYYIELATKGMLLNSGMQMRQNIISCGDTVIIRIYNDWVALRASLAMQYTLPVAKRTLDTKTLEEEANVLEKQLARSSSIFAKGQQLLKTTWKDIQETLSENESSIEFSSFTYYDGKRWTDSTYYVALVLRKNDEYPKMVYLCEEKQLDSVLNKVTGSDAQKTEQLYSARGVGINVTTQSLHLASRLYDLIWRPIDSLLKDITTVYYSPSGLLHKISFAAIATPDSMCLMDKYKLVQLGSTAEIVRSENKDQYISVSDIAFICGGINYDQMKTDNGIEEEKELFVYNRGPQISNDSTRSISWRYLPGTYKEARYIDSLFRKNKISTALYSDSNATETLFKNLSGKGPQIIHLSTHGYFFPEPKKEKPKDAFIKMGEETYRYSENPLLRSGLIFAGANYVWKGGEQTPGQDDGILTAYEVSNMNLYDTKLVVMSACETGLGDIKGSEGVFGLQRAFKMAGVDYIIMSLWKVPDKETTEFMKLFYSICLSNHSIRESFYLTQSTMRKKYDPYYWAAFVLME